MSELLRVVASTSEERAEVGGYDAVLGENLTLKEAQELVKENIGKFIGGSWPECMSNIKLTEDEIQERINNLKES